MRTLAVSIVLVVAGAGAVAAQTPGDEQKVLQRRCHEGEKLAYMMKATNESWHYSIEADGLTKKDPDGSCFDEFRWSEFASEGKLVVLSPATLDFREQLTLDPNHKPAIPDFSKFDPRIIGPVTDLMTFYVDYWLGAKIGKLVHAGDHFYFKRGTPNSWADGAYVLLGEDSIDFDYTLKAVDRSAGTATLVVRHVPPEKPEIKIPAEWMQKPVSDTPNNWVQIQKTQDGKFLGAVGKETFEVTVQLSLADGKILSARMNNPVETVERECQDAALTKCGEPKPHAILRQVEISLKP